MIADNDNMTPVISIVGKTNSGKTTFLERVIPVFKKKGYRIGTIKHDVHYFDIDHKGKDTYRMTDAGSDTVVIVSKEKMAMVKQLQGEPPVDMIVQQLFDDVDLVFTEGFKKQNKPKIEVTSTGDLLCRNDETLRAVILNAYSGPIRTGLHMPKTIPSFKIQELSEIIEFIENMLPVQKKEVLAMPYTGRAV